MYTSESGQDISMMGYLRDGATTVLGTFIALNYSALLGIIPPLIGLLTVLVRWLYGRHLRELRRERDEALRARDDALAARELARRQADDLRKRYFRGENR